MEKSSQLVDAIKTASLKWLSGTAFNPAHVTISRLRQQMISQLTLIEMKRVKSLGVGCAVLLVNHIQFLTQLLTQTLYFLSKTIETSS